MSIIKIKIGGVPEHFNLPIHFQCSTVVFLVLQVTVNACAVVVLRVVDLAFGWSAARKTDGV